MCVGESIVIEKKNIVCKTVAKNNSSLIIYDEIIEWIEYSWKIGLL